MPNIKIMIRDKKAIGDQSRIVCGNSDYSILFDFDAEWDEYDVKTARFVYAGMTGKYIDVVFSGSTCKVPVLQDTIGVYVGVYAGELHTTTPAWFECDKSILCGSGSPVEPEPDVYAQLMTIIQGIEITDRKTMEEAVAAASAAAEAAFNAAKDAEKALGESSWIGFELDEDGTLYAVLSPGADASFYLDENGYLEVEMNV